MAINQDAGKDFHEGRLDESTSGAGTAPQRSETVWKWANTSNQITEIDCDNAGASDYKAGSMLKVWGAD